ncbi:nucleotidyltransferase domain-containing protein (plasmid) [Cupriavidus basilensis]
MLPPDTFDAKASMSALPLQFTQASADFLERLAAELDVPPSRYDEAKNRYESVSTWLDRDASTLKQYNPLVYVQGSFRLGTPIRPANQDEHYDIDLVCELTVGKNQVSQEKLKDLLGDEMRAYAKAHGMEEPSEGRRCWVLDYAKDAQFHLDALPAVPDAAGMRHQLAARAMTSPWAETAIAITDIHHPAYRRVDSNWPHSNPRGYTEWFRSRMRLAFQAKRSAMALTVQASVESIPSYRVKTPLQQVVQILKRHRDLMFIDDPDNKPISVIITTLAAHAYGNEATVADAMSAILSGMAKHVRFSADGRVIIANPTDPMENFADKWVEYPERRDRILPLARESTGKISHGLLSSGRRSNWLHRPRGPWERPSLAELQVEPIDRLPSPDWCRAWPPR